MTAYVDKENHIVISEDDARGGVTGHNVRYVLMFGMAGAVAVFTSIALYFGFDRLQQRLSAFFARGPIEVIQGLVPYAVIVLLGLAGAGLLLSLWNMISGVDDDESQRFMRARVVTQFAVVCVIMAMAYIAVA